MLQTVYNTGRSERRVGGILPSGTGAIHPDGVHAHAARADDVEWIAADEPQLRGLLPDLVCKVLVARSRGFVPLDLVDGYDILEHAGVRGEVLGAQHRVGHHGLGPVGEDHSFEGGFGAQAAEGWVHVGECRQVVVGFQ